MSALRNNEGGGRISEVLIVCKSMQMEFQTKQSVRIIIDGYIFGASGRWGSTVFPNGGVYWGIECYV